MINFSTGLTLLVLMLFPEILFSQHVNGDKLNFPKGKSEWSDTIYKKLRTKQMVKDDVSAVLLGIRFKLDKETDSGKWYLIEITNKSHETKVKFKVRAGHNQDVYTVKLDPEETKSVRKFYWTAANKGTGNPDREDKDYIYYPLEELLER